MEQCNCFLTVATILQNKIHYRQLE